MALNPSGVMSIGGPTVGASINLELNLLGTANSSIGQATFRALAVVPAGPISLSDFYGKSNITVISISTNTVQYSLTPAVVPGYVPGEAEVKIVIDPGIYLYSNDINAAGLTISGFVAGDSITVENNGYVFGRGGNGQSTVITTGPYQNIAPQNGGTGLVISGSGIVVNLINSSYLAGGGGGGAGTYASGCGGGAGGGAGGNAGGPVPGGPAGGYAIGGAGGGPGQIGTNGQSSPSGGVAAASGGGGGRIFPGGGGAGGSFSGGVIQGGFGGGAGGGGGAARYPGNFVGNGTAGGSGGNPGVVSSNCTGGGGGWGATGGFDSFQGFPGLGGPAIRRNGNTCNITNFGVIYGAII